MAKKTSVPAKTLPLPAPVADVFPIVGIGASAGGLAAFEAFFSALPTDADPGMAFVVVQHLAPDHKSMLPELLRRFTRLAVREVETGVLVERNCVYVLPPNHDMALLGASLTLLEPSAPRGQRLPIDFFFRSLAQNQKEKAIGIVLSGTGSDGALGVRAIKEAGGLVMAQTACEFDGMPRSAMATGVVDFELPAEQMVAHLLHYVAHAQVIATGRASSCGHMSDAALKTVFGLLRAQTGHDFSQYKLSTIERRIERRMTVHQLVALEDYVATLQGDCAEVEALFRDLLIGVTSFFRDPELFQALEEQVIAQLFAGKSTAGGQVRVWVAGCSTGEEAYSLAILLQERMDALRQGYTVQVFATDIDSRAIARARVGRYPVGIAADLSPLRLARFFTPEPDGSGYRVHKSIRDMLVFSEHDLLKDPPFSKLDLIVCRNLLIYFDKGLQERVMPLFHYALHPLGVLFLGSSEGVGDFQDLFFVLDHKAKLYQRKNAAVAARRGGVARYPPPVSALEAALPYAARKSSASPKVPLRTLTEQALLAQVAPAGALIQANGDVLYLHGRTGMYLEPAPGEVGVINILKMAREGLRSALGNALHKAVATQQTVPAASVRVKTNGHFSRVRLSVGPVPATASAAAPDSAAATALSTAGNAALYLVIFEAALEDPGAPVTALVSQAEASQSPATLALIASLRDELRIKDDYLQRTHEELEAANEELKSSVEEMQSVNEEMQSVNEELETSKEEQQSVNEELTTVNTELGIKVEDLSRLNNDMNNLLAGTGIATVFVDHRLRILRFTPTASQLINLIDSDVGRPVGHVASNLVRYTSLLADAQAVLDTLVPKETQVQTTTGDWYTLRIRPYRTLANVIEGAVITFSDITAFKHSEAALERANQLGRLAVIVRDIGDAVTVQDLDGRILAWNPGAERLYGWTEAQALQLNVRDRIPKALQGDTLQRLHQLSQAQTLEPYQTQRLTRDGASVEVSMTASALIGEDGRVYAISTIERAGKP